MLFIKKCNKNVITGKANTTETQANNLHFSITRLVDFCVRNT